MKKVILKIDGMSCSACKNTLEKYLNKQEGVSASVNLVMQQAFIKYDEKLVTLNDLDKFVFDAGYTSLGIFDEKMETKKDRKKLVFFIFTFLIIIFMYIIMSSIFNLPIFNFLNVKKNPIVYIISLFILTVPFLIYGKDILISGIKKIIKKSPNMDSLVTMGVLITFIYSFVYFILVLCGNNYIDHIYFESCAMILYFVKLGKIIDSRSKEKTRESISELVQITPSYALLKKDDKEIELTIDDVKKGDILIAKPGMKIAVDGVIVKGVSHLEESFITGESLPVKKTVDEKVIAGSVNIDGIIEYKALKIGKDSMISEIVRLVSESVNTTSKIERIVDKVSSIFVPTIIGISILTFIIYLIIGKTFVESILTLVTILVVSCPCALGLATPLAIVVSVGCCARNGILIRKSETLEYLSKIDTIVFDKTGTLTYGDIRISRLANYSDYSNNKLLNIVASLEHYSTHPIANAFKMYDPKYEVVDFLNIEGMGITGKIGNRDFLVGNNKFLKHYDIENKYMEVEENFSSLGNSILYVVEKKTIIGIIGVKDIVRKNTKKIIESLKNKNIDVILLSGDKLETANIIANSLAIDEVKAEMLPKGKKEFIENLQNNGKKVMMVGDGINDALSLSSAIVGVSMKGSVDIALNSSDVIILNDSLYKIIDLLNIGKKTIRIIKENLFWAFFYNFLMIPIAIGVLKPFSISLNPMIASIMMTFSSLTVVFNSLRLRNINNKKFTLKKININRWHNEKK